MYIYSLNDEDGIKHVGIETSEPLIRREAMLDPDTIYFFAERGSA